jgi:hypothetical protein
LPLLSQISTVGALHRTGSRLRATYNPGQLAAALTRLAESLAGPT